MIQPDLEQRMEGIEITLNKISASLGALGYLLTSKEVFTIEEFHEQLVRFCDQVGAQPPDFYWKDPREDNASTPPAKPD